MYACIDDDFIGQKQGGNIYTWAFSPQCDM